MRTREWHADASDDVPEWLLVGACIESWSRTGDAMEAFRRFLDARNAWVAAGGDPEAAEHGPLSPWSYYRALEQHGPERTRDRLTRLGLPPDWVPSYIAGRTDGRDGQ